MRKPDPAPGLVIRYDYLWHDEAARGRQEGSKERPCAIILTTISEDEDTRVWLVPITHTAPTNLNTAIEIPPKVKKHLGLDEARSWIITTELNRVAWNDQGIVPVKGQRWDYGFLPSTLAKAVSDRVLEHQRQRRRIIDRVALQKQHTRDDDNGY